MEPIWNQAALIRYMSGGQVQVPLVIRTVNSIGLSAAAQHSARPESMFMHVPGIKVVIPATPYDAKGLLKTAIRDNNPVLFLEHKMLYQTRCDVPKAEYTIPLGRADITRPGTDVTLIATSWMALKALEAAEELAKQGISAEVIDPRTLVPLDEETLLQSVRKTGRAVVIHEAHAMCGIGAEIAYIISEKAFSYLDAPVKRVTAYQVPIPYSQKLEKLTVPSVQRIVDAAKEVLYL